MAVGRVIEPFFQPRHPLTPGYLTTTTHPGVAGATVYIITFLSVHSATNSALPPSLLGLRPYISSFGTAFVPAGQLGHRYQQRSSTRTRILGLP